MKLPSPKHYPKEWLINGELWTLKFGRPAKICKGAKLGLCDPSTRTIIINPKQSKDEMLCTFIHELIHAIDMEYDIKIPHKLIYKMELWMFDLLTANNWEVISILARIKV